MSCNGYKLFSLEIVIFDVQIYVFQGNGYLNLI